MTLQGVGWVPVAGGYGFRFSKKKTGTKTGLFSVAFEPDRMRLLCVQYFELADTAFADVLDPTGISATAPAVLFEVL